MPELLALTVPGIFLYAGGLWLKEPLLKEKGIRYFFPVTIYYRCRGVLANWRIAMPELKPCPACRSRGVICILDDDEMYSVDCGNCAMRGPAEHNPDFAEAAWNSLPRRPDYNDVDCAGCPERRRSLLTWTTEPPKVAGWYWCRPSTLNMPRCVEVYGAWEHLMFGSKRDDFNPQIPVTRKGFEWAGPIPMPLEPEES